VFSVLLLLVIGAAVVGRGLGFWLLGFMVVGEPKKKGGERGIGE